MNTISALANLVSLSPPPTPMSWRHNVVPSSICQSKHPPQRTANSGRWLPQPLTRLATRSLGTTGHSLTNV